MVMALTTLAASTMTASASNTQISVVDFVWGFFARYVEGIGEAAGIWLAVGAAAIWANVGVRATSVEGGVATDGWISSTSPGRRTEFSVRLFSVRFGMLKPVP